MNLVFLGIFLCVIFLFGGASRADVLSQPVVRIASIMMIAGTILQMNRSEWQEIRLPFLFLTSVALVVVIQLVPLPPGLWFSLPGHERYAVAMAEAGVADVWRPISLTPDLTIDSLLTLLPPMAAVLAMGLIGRRFYHCVLAILLVGILVSALIALLQITGGGPYFYRITNFGTGVGVFANRNHQAALLAVAPVLVAAWILMPNEDPAYRRLKFWLGLCAIAAVLPLVLITGSRAGFALAVVGLCAAVALRFRLAGRLRGGGLPFGRFKLVAAIPVLIGILAVGATLYMSRDVALQRLFDAGADKRTEYLAVYIQVIKDFFPFGSGFGGFEPVFRGYEPHAQLTTEYMNQAHNDLAQSMMEGGVLSLLLLLCLVAWLTVRGLRLWLSEARDSADILGRAGFVALAILLMASLVDYPLRTPLVVVLFAIMSCWLLSQRNAEAAAWSKGGLGSPQGVS